MRTIRRKIRALKLIVDSLRSSRKTRYEQEIGSVAVSLLQIVPRAGVECRGTESGRALRTEEGRVIGLRVD